jgi:chromosome segregation ATPase
MVLRGISSTHNEVKQRMSSMALTMDRGIIRLLLLFITIASMASAQTAESVTSQKDRCLRKLEDIERNLENSASGIERIKRLRLDSKSSAAPTDAFVEKTQSKIEYMHSHIERVRNQVEKIENDLQSVKSGGKCPKCIGSDVNLFCRHVESLFSENADLTSAINQFEHLLRAEASSGNRDAATGFALEAGDSAAALQGSSAIDHPCKAEIKQASNRIEEARRAVGSNPGAKASAVLEKAMAHFEKGKALCAEGKTEAADTELSIAGKFASAAERAALGK